MAIDQFEFQQTDECLFEPKAAWPTTTTSSSSTTSKPADAKWYECTFQESFCDWRLSGAISDGMFYWNRTNGQELGANELIGPVSDHNNDPNGNILLSFFPFVLKTRVYICSVFLCFSFLCCCSPFIFLFLSGYFLYSNALFAQKEGATAAFETGLNEKMTICLQFQYWFEVIILICSLLNMRHKKNTKSFSYLIARRRHQKCVFHHQRHGRKRAH